MPEHSKEKIANPFHPGVSRLQNEANRRLMEFVKDYLQVKTAFFNTEVVDQLGNSRNKAGLDLMIRTALQSEEESRETCHSDIAGCSGIDHGHLG